MNINCELLPLIMSIKYETEALHSPQHSVSESIVVHVSHGDGAEAQRVAEV